MNASPTADPSRLLFEVHRAIEGVHDERALCESASGALTAAGLPATVTTLSPSPGPGRWQLPVDGREGAVAWLAGAGDAPPAPGAVDPVRQLLSLAFQALHLDRAREAMQSRIEHARKEQREILDALQDGYYEVDLRGRALFLNAAFSRMLGYTPQEIETQDFRERQSPEMTAHIVGIFTEVFATGRPKVDQVWAYWHKDGRTVQVEGSVQLMHDAQGQAIGFRGIVRDVTEKRRVESALRESEARFRALTSISSDFYWEQDAAHRMVLMENRHAQTDEAQRVFLGKPIWDGPLSLHGKTDWSEHRRRLDAHEPFRDVVLEGQMPDGKSYFLAVSGEPVFGDDGAFAGYRGVTRDITAQKRAEARAQHIAMHDGLTGLPNRRMFMELLKGAIASASRYERRFAVLFLDLDRFKFINDTLGHEAGDRLLTEITARFTSAIRASDVVARLGGDEFVVLALETADAQQAGAVARKLLVEAERPVRLAGQDCRISASVGIALYPDHGADEQALMKNADIAMYVAKDSGKNTFQVFSSEIDSRSMERFTLENHLRHALDRGEFVLHYQAKLDLRGSGIKGVEALLRWNSPELGSVSPVRFIPIAEESGTIVAIGRWVLRTACEQAMAWQRQGFAPIQMAVNISPRQFGDEHLLRDIRQILDETGLDPQLLELEITEGMLIHDAARALSLLRDIKALGVRLAVDDFGTGYSSLGQLKNFPIDTLKVDRSFISDLADNAEDKAIASAIVAMGRTLGLTVVAEGVETAAQQQFLREQACDEMQGFYFARPVAPDELAALLRQHPHVSTSSG